MYTKDYREKVKTDDPEKYHAKNLDETKATLKRSIKKAVEEKKHHCVVCSQVTPTRDGVRKSAQQAAQSNPLMGVKQV